jgi:guanyl-specific ribonuclease Sa
MEETMTRLMLAILLMAFAVGSATAQVPAAGTCESKAVSKAGKPLAGAAKNSFMAKCKRDACAPKAIGSDGKALKGAAKKSFMDKCQREQA